VVLVFDDDLELDTALFEVRRGGVAVALEPQAFDVLAYLVAHRDRVVPKEELMDAVWGGRFVSETAVTSRIKQARRAVGDDGQAQRLIRTLHGRGYRFVADVEVADGDAAAGAVPEPRAEPSGSSAPVRYTVSDGLHIAYQVTGSGDRDIVLASGFVSHLEQDWGDPRHAHYLERLGSWGRLIRFDKRGTGMSDRPKDVPDVETRMHDVLAVMDAVGSERAVLHGYSEGGAMSIMFAALHPERVESLVLYACYAKRIWSTDYPWAQTEEQRAAYTDRLVDEWDWEADCRMRTPSSDLAMQQWWARRMRASATPSTIRALMEMNSKVDVRTVLPSVRVPTLVLHRRSDPLFRVEEAQYIADHIPGARLVLLDGADHFVSGDPDQLLDAMEPFVRRPTPPAPPVTSVLAAVVAVTGPEADELTSRLVGAGGRPRPTPYGGDVLLFDGPATAVRAIASAGRHRTSCGLSVAEVPSAGVVEGVEVRVALSLAAATPERELWVSGTAAVLLGGSGVAIDPAGTHDLGGGGAQQEAHRVRT